MLPDSPPDTDAPCPGCGAGIDRKETECPECRLRFEPDEVSIDPIQENER